MAKVMKMLIEMKKYETQKDVIDRLNSFVAWEQITVDEYNELMELAEQIYNPAPPIEEQPVDDTNEK